jgi:hypothetical protein
MQKREVQRLFKTYIQPEFPQFYIQGHLLYLKPVDYLLRGICFESSGYGKNHFNIYVFVQPTFIPRDYLWFNFGDRLHHMVKGNDYWWTINDQNEKEVMESIVGLLHQAKSTYLDNFYEPRDLVKRLPKMRRRDKSIEGQRTIAFTHILEGERKQALFKLDRLSKELGNYYLENPQIKWVNDINLEVGEIRTRLLDSNELAIALLNQWRRETMMSIDLEKEI